MNDEVFGLTAGKELLPRCKPRGVGAFAKGFDIVDTGSFPHVYLKGRALSRN